MSCQTCAETFPTFLKLKAHCRVRQHAYFLFKCGSCNESYRRLADLDQHMSVHDPPSDPVAVAASSLAMGEISRTIIDDSKPTTANIKDDEIANVPFERVGSRTGDETPTDGCGSMSSGLSSYGTIGSLTPPLSPILSNHPATENGSMIGEWEVISSHPISRATSVSSVPPQNTSGPSANEISGRESISRPELPDHFKILLQKYFTWICPLCPRSYPNQYSLNKHRQQKHNYEEPPSDVQVTRVEQISVEGGFFDAGQAAITLDTADEAYIYASISTSTSMKPLVCALCGKEFSTSKGLEDHLGSSAGAHCFFKCSSCPRKFITAELLRKHHVKKHAVSQQPPNGVPPSTARIVQPRSQIPIPSQKQLLLERPCFSCKICGKKMANEQALKCHEESGTKAHKKFKCSSCKGAYMTQERLDAHRNTVHSGSRIEVISRKPNFVCDICGKEFDKKKALKSHILSEAQSHSTWKCSLCDRVFIARLQLEKHQAKKHLINPDGTPNSRSNGSSSGVGQAAEERTFTCLICPASFSKPSAVAHHLESGCHSTFTRHHITAAVKALDIVPQITVKQIAGPVEPPAPIKVYEASSSTWNGSEFKCFLCPKGFVSLRGLNSHLNSASHDDKEFKCPKCRSKFILISALVQHLESLACGLAQAGEIINFYDALSAKFSNKLLTA